MGYDKALIAGKLRRWEKYLERFRLPAWDDIPDFGLYMEQTVQLLKQYLSYLPPELKQSQTITAAAINNYVRTKMLPEPRKKPVAIPPAEMLLPALIGTDIELPCLLGKTVVRVNLMNASC